MNEQDVIDAARYMDSISALNKVPIQASASLYSADCRAIENALAAGRAFARKHNHVFEGMQIDIDEQGFVHIHIIGVDSFKL